MAIPSGGSRVAEIIILGGGVAGLTAAKALAPFHKVTIVEEGPRLGGVGGTLSCKAGTECSVCSACTIPELVEGVVSEPNVTARTDATVTGDVLRVGESVSLEGLGDRFAGDAFIVATGHSIADGSELSEYGAHLDRVVTALEMDRLLRTAGEGGGEPPLPAEGEASVAIIQCVCSRDTGELPYCSRVCCAYSARLAMELRRLRPNARVTVFYMDLQREDAVASRQIDEAMADEGISYVRSRPASVQGVPGGGVEVLYEDTLAGEIRTDEFDLVVLSTGLVPSEGTRRFATMLGLETDEHGFVATGEDCASTSVEDVFAAGGATGPVDLVEAAMGGLAAAAAVLARHPPRWPSYPPRVIVLGGGPAAEAADRASRAAGADTSMVLGAPGRGLKRLEGEPMSFKASMGVPGGDPTVSLEGDLVIAVPEVAGGVPDGPRGSITHHQLARELAGGEVGASPRVALVMGAGAEALILAADLVDRVQEARVDVLYRDMSVAEGGMQELQLELAERGVRFHRYKDRSLRVAGQGPLRVSFVDEMSPELGPLELEVDVLATPSRGTGAGLVWPWFLSRHAPGGTPSNLRLNVLPVLTPRRGVYTTTPATRTGASGVLGGPAAAAMAMAEFAGGYPLMEEVAVVDPDKCAACLNCLRACPHDAIAFDEEARAAVVLARACQDCGVCRGICPAEAIEMVPRDELEVGR